jgi:hypothetical protein
MLRNGIRLVVFCMEAQRLSRSAQTGGAFMHDEQKEERHSSGVAGGWSSIECVK